MTKRVLFSHWYILNTYSTHTSYSYTYEPFLLLMCISVISISWALVPWLTTEALRHPLLTGPFLNDVVSTLLQSLSVLKRTNERMNPCRVQERHTCASMHACVQYVDMHNQTQRERCWKYVGIISGGSVKRQANGSLGRNQRTLARSPPAG